MLLTWPSLILRSLSSWSPWLWIAHIRTLKISLRADLALLKL
jgi:hypothetical protein